MYTKMLSAIVALLLSVVTTATGQQHKYIGKLLPELRPATYSQSAVLEPATADLIAELPSAPAEGALVFATKLSVAATLPEYQFVVVVSSLEPQLAYYVDFEGKGKLEAVPPPKGGHANLTLPVSLGMYGKLTAVLAYRENTYRGVTVKVESKAEEQSASAPARTKSNMPPLKRSLTLQPMTTLAGTVDIDGQKTLFTYSLNLDDLAKPKVSLTKGYLWVDCDGDGKLDGNGNVEVATARGEPVVFRVGKHYIATRSVDLKTGEIVVEEHPASDYQRIELAAGTQVPNFTFRDFDGKAHELAEYRGKYVLLDFWGTWWKACLGEVPHLKAAYEKYRSRGFEILGLNMEDYYGGLSPEKYAKNTEKARSCASAKGMTWPQAIQESIEKLVLNRFQVRSYPVGALLGPDGKIISVDVRDEKLSQTLEKLLPGQ